MEEVVKGDQILNTVKGRTHVTFLLISYREDPHVIPETNKRNGVVNKDGKDYECNRLWGR